MLNIKEFGRSIKNMRKANNLQISELAVQVDADYTNLSRFESGERWPTVLTTINILNYFNVGFDECVAVSNEENTEYHQKIWGLLSTIKEEQDVELLRRFFSIIQQNVGE